jgi:pimeloyl-ACP methyl ester carboxylesterase
MAPSRLRLTVPIIVMALAWPAAAVPAQAAAPAQAPVPAAVVPSRAVAAASAHTSSAQKAKVDRVRAPKIGWYKAKAWSYYLATVRLPLDYDHPHGATVQVALAKIPAADPSRRIGTLFLNPGGPGGSGVQLALQAPTFLSQDILDRFDIVGFDPRGTNYGTKVKCFSGYRSSTLTLQDLDGIPVGKAERRTYLRAAKKLATGCSHHGRRIASAMSTTEVARDMDVLRRSVGDSRLTYLGFSYGTYLGEVYASMFPDRFRAIALDGVIDPVAWRGSAKTAGVPMSLRLNAAEGAWKALSTAFALCKAAGPTYCELPDPMATLKAVASELRGGSLETLFGTLSYSDLVSTLLDALYNQTYGPETAVGLVAATQDALTGGSDDEEFLFKLLKKVRASRSGFNFPYDNSTDAYSAVMCTDAAEPRKQSTWTKAIARRSATAPYFADAWGWSDAQCARQYWTARDEDRYRGSFSKRTAKPVLLVGDYYDPATAYTGAVSTHKRMPNSWLITSDSWGHTAYGTSDCVTSQVDAYLLHGAKPSPQVCESDYVPFSDPLVTTSAVKATMTQAAASGMGPITAQG